jgi:hypothetical protein
MKMTGSPPEGMARPAPFPAICAVLFQLPTSIDSPDDTIPVTKGGRDEDSDRRSRRRSRRSSSGPSTCNRRQHPLLRQRPALFEHGDVHCADTPRYTSMLQTWYMLLLYFYCTVR